MTGYLTQTLGEWMVKHDKDEKLYLICPDTQKWSKRTETQKFLKEGIEVVFDFVIKGEYCETKEEITKNYFAKIKQVEHSSITK
jgi:hypothetical protein